jgi:hypothetical protein
MTDEISQIEYTKEESNINSHTRICINVKGNNLDECRKHFDEIRISNTVSKK